MFGICQLITMLIYNNWINCFRNLWSKINKHLLAQKKFSGIRPLKNTAADCPDKTRSPQQEARSGEEWRLGVEPHAGCRTCNITRFCFLNINTGIGPHRQQLSYLLHHLCLPRVWHLLFNRRYKYSVYSSGAWWSLCVCSCSHMGSLWCSLEFALGLTGKWGEQLTWCLRSHIRLLLIISGEYVEFSVWTQL